MSPIIDRYVGKPVLVQLKPDCPYTLCAGSGQPLTPLAVLARTEPHPQTREPVRKGYILESHLLGKCIAADDHFLLLECANPSDPSKVLPISINFDQIATCTGIEDASKLVGVATDAMGPGAPVLGVQAQ